MKSEEQVVVRKTVRIDEEQMRAVLLDWAVEKLALNPETTEVKIKRDAYNTYSAAYVERTIV